MIRTLTFTPSKYPGEAETGYASIDQTIVMRCRYTGRTERLSFGYQRPAGAGRLVTGGPLVPGPWTASSAQASVLDTMGGTQGAVSRQQAKDLQDGVLLALAVHYGNVEGDHAEQLRTAARLLLRSAEPEITAEVGDLFLLDGRLWELCDDKRMDYPRLVLLRTEGDQLVPDLPEERQPVSQ